ncbi:ABC transporter ATP-binding protein [Streptomonospora salina]|uniref:ABC-2 type transport system ATP-binding protein n=1 Tax=Streptomonospora salina TaxID=104205 RepID=A0A841EM35_9ACTN|nr:ABC transporter ATP-binding protein [Streptomonospora salina]MBB6000481.1 ABC-2 type transport system ATP-binding protein [Streptomonospora salina]
MSPGVGGCAVATHALERDYGGGAGVFDVDLRVPEGGAFGLVGLNGAGKTTLLMLLSGMRTPGKGRIEHSYARSSIAVCPDVPEFEPWLTAAEVVASAAGLAGIRPAPEEVSTLVERVGMSAAADRRTRGFSRGMKQRLGMAAALIQRPRLLILDEPAAGLDPQGRADVLDLVSALRGETTMVFSSHLLTDVQRVCDDVAVLRAGRLVYQGAVDELLAQHVRPSWELRVRGRAAAEVRELLAAEPWVVSAEEAGGDTVVVDADSVPSGETGIPALLVREGIALTSMVPCDARLEAAFMSLTQEEAT